MSGIDSAVERLDRALERLDQALDGLIDSSRETDVLLADRAQLANELDAALAREHALQGLADEASAALGSAIEEVRAALGREE